MTPKTGSLSPLAAAILIAAGAVALDMTGALAQSAAAPTPAELIDQLKSKRSGPAAASAPADAASSAERSKLIKSLRSKAELGLSVSEREQLAEAVRDRPSVDLEVYFDYNSADITEAARPSLASLGEALKAAELKGASFLVAGHTDAKGRASYNQKLSERRARSVKAYLVETFELPADQLTVVGYGSERLKLPRDPAAGENRRVQIINLAD